MPSESEVAWAAGIFEGEGSIVTPDTRVRLQVKMTDHDVILRLHSVLGGSVYGPYAYEQPDGHVRKPAWVWNTNGTDVSRVAALLVPWLGQRRLARMAEVGLLDSLPLFGDESVPRGT